MARQKISTLYSL